MSGWRMKGCLILLAVAMVTSAIVPARATTLRYLPLEEQALTAEAIVVATARQNTSAWDDASRIIYTETRFEVQETVKGTVTAAVTTRQIGGQVGDFAQSVPGSPVFAPGRSYVLFLERRPDGFWRVVGFSQGSYPVTSASDGSRTVQPSLAAAGGVALVGAGEAEKFSPQPLADFLAKIRSLVGAGDR